MASFNGRLATLSAVRKTSLGLFLLPMTGWVRVGRDRSKETPSEVLPESTKGCQPFIEGSHKLGEVTLRLQLHAVQSIPGLLGPW